MKVAQLCPTLCDPMYYSPPGFSVLGILQAGSRSLLQGIFPTQGLNLGLPHCRLTLYCLSHQGSPAGDGLAISMKQYRGGWESLGLGQDFSPSLGSPCTAPCTQLGRPASLPVTWGRDPLPCRLQGLTLRWKSDGGACRPCSQVAGALSWFCHSPAG